MTIFRRMILDPSLIPFKVINLKWIKYLNIRPEETIREKLLDIGLGNEFLDMTTKAQAAKTSGNTSN